MTRNVIITLLVLCLPAMAAAPALIIPPADSVLTTVEIDWTAAPTSVDNGIVETIWLDTISFGVAGTARTVTITDKQTSAKTVLTAVPLSANQFTTITFPGVRFAGGFTIVASGAGVVYQFRGRVRR